MSTRKRSISEIIEMSRAGITVDGDEALTAIAALSTMLISYITGDTFAERKDKVIADLNKTADDYLGESNPLKNPEVAKSSLKFTRYGRCFDTQRCLPDGSPSDPEALRADLEREREDARYYRLTDAERDEETRQYNEKIRAERKAIEAEEVQA